MKQATLLLFLLMLPFSGKAQYYNPYGNPYTNSNAAAYEWGRNLAAQQQEMQRQRDMDSKTGCLSRIVEAITMQDYDTAGEWADYLREHDEGLGRFYLGLIYELSGYSKSAREEYAEGVRRKSSLCKAWLNRLNNEGPMTKAQKRNVVNYFINMRYQATSIAQSMTNSILDDNSYYESSPNRSRSSQKANCSVCHGTGYDPTPYSHSASADSYLNHSGNRCPYCGKTTKHYHYRCRH